MSEKTQSHLPGGDLELALLSALWDRDQATARELHKLVGARRDIVYTTVAKVLDRLVEKRMVRRRRVGRSFSYSALIQRAETQRAIARGLIEQLTGDDPQPAVAALLGAMEDVSPDLLKELALELEARRRARRGT